MMKSIIGLLRRSSRHLLFVLVLATSAAIVNAGSETVPNLFSGGGAISAGEMNANFQHLADRSWALSTSGDHLYYDDGNIGIGTASPNAKLDVVGTVQATSFLGDGSGLTGISGGDNDWTISGVDMYSSVSGNVGIGTTSPGATLEVRRSGASSVPDAIKFGDDFGQAFLGAGSNYFGLTDQNLTPRLAILQSNGNVGIGTTSPTEKLHIKGGNLQIDNSHPSINYVLSGNDEIARFVVHSPGGLDSRLGMYFYGSAHSTRPDSVQIRNAGNQTRVHIAANGNVGIGTISPSERLHVIGNINANGTVYSSSRRWKTNIQTIERALDKVGRLRGVTYDWKSDGKHDIGLIAEEVGQVIPEVVAFEENGQDARGLDYARLVAVLIEAVKDQQEIITQQNSKLSQLEARMAKYEAALDKLEILTAAR